MHSMEPKQSDPAIKKPHKQNSVTLLSAGHLLHEAKCIDCYIDDKFGLIGNTVDMTIG